MDGKIVFKIAMSNIHTQTDTNRQNTLTNRTVRIPFKPELFQALISQLLDWIASITPMIIDVFISVILLLLIYTFFKFYDNKKNIVESMTLKETA